MQCKGFIYARSKPEIDVEKLTHFALGIFWKAGVHSWKKNKDEPMINLGVYGQPLRIPLKCG